MSTCHCDCHGMAALARSSSSRPASPVPVENVCAPTTASANPSASNSNARPLASHEALALLVQRLVRELASVQARLARVEADVVSVEVRDALAAERQLHATLLETAPREEEEEEEEDGEEEDDDDEDGDEDIATEQPLLFTLLDASENSGGSDAEASSSDAASESEWELQIAPRQPTATTTTGARKKGAATALNSPRTTARGRRRVLCSVADCRFVARVGGRCRCHSDTPRPQCAEPGCTNVAFRKAKCWRHGAKQVCSEHGCSKGAVRRGKCCRHGGSAPCTVEGCIKISRRAGKCLQHLREEATRVKNGF